MANKKVINFYSCGDSNDIKTWSNVPFLFAKALEQLGFTLNRFNIAPNPIVNKIYNTLSYTLFQRICKRNACPTFARSWIHRFWIQKRLDRIAKKYDGTACLNLFLSYSFCNSKSIHPSVLWCDWSDAIVIARIGRNVKSYERKWLEYEADVIKKAHAVYSMFPQCGEDMSKIYNREVICLGMNGVNTVFDGEIDIDKLVQTHSASNRILFIGNHRYIKGLNALIESIRKLRENGVEFNLDVIGINSSQMCDVPEWVSCYGYLDKSKIYDRDLYYNLIFGAKLIVNPTVGWAGYSSIVEAMYYGTPIVVSPFEDFVAEFGSEISFGAYVRDNNKLSEKILEVALSNNYDTLCRNAHNVVAKYTWHNYVKRFISDLHARKLL